MTHHVQNSFRIIMGLKKGRELFSQKSAVSTTLRKLREKIIKEKGADSDYRPFIAIDGEVWARQALANPQKDSKVSCEYHSEPKVPVVSVSTSVVKKLKLLRYTMGLSRFLYLMEQTIHSRTMSMVSDMKRRESLWRNAIQNCRMHMQIPINIQLIKCKTYGRHSYVHVKILRLRLWRKPRRISSL